MSNPSTTEADDCHVRPQPEIEDTEAAGAAPFVRLSQMKTGRFAVGVMLVAVVIVVEPPALLSKPESRVTGVPTAMR